MKAASGAAGQVLDAGERRQPLDLRAPRIDGQRAPPKPILRHCRITSAATSPPTTAMLAGLSSRSRRVACPSCITVPSFRCSPLVHEHLAIPPIRNLPRGLPSSNDVDPQFALDVVHGAQDRLAQDVEHAIDLLA
jgi:hypothetical protein